MNPRLNFTTALLLTVPPLMWAANAVLGRLLAPLVPPLTLNFLRWLLAFFILLPFAWRLLRTDSPVWPRMGRYAVLGLLGIGCYNAFQYLALKTSMPVNVTLVGSSMPVFMLVLGMLFFGQRITRRQMIGAVLSVAGVLVVLSHGDFQQLAQVRFVAGDLYMIVATIAWALYSWLLTLPGDAPEVRSDWVAFLMAQLVPGLAWSALFAGAETAVGAQPVQWGWPLAAGLVFIAVGPAILAYRSWGLGVQRVGPNIAGFFANLTPLFAGIFSAAFLGEPPRLYHALAFALIASGIVVSSRK
ncbi:MAG TPA: DMT family transporter [Ramlibacter sp.]|jgi:drug/metabolite transporter (DMT)-like permease|nr:DMT family transporter [Ramlibacter sp.]